MKDGKRVELDLEGLVRINHAKDFSLSQVFPFKRPSLGFLWLSNGWDSVLPLQGTQVQSLVRKL